MAQARHDSITRRSLLSGAAAVAPAAAMPAAGLPASPASPASPATLAAAPAAPDPIFALIAAHVRAYDDVNAILDTVAAAEDALDARISNV